MFEIKHERSAHKVGTDGVLLGAWAEHKNPTQILDVGCGTGLIGLMLAQRYVQAQITGIDIDPDSIEEAFYNCHHSPFSERMSLKKSDFLQWQSQAKFDLIVSNPPFYKADYKSPQRNRDRARRALALPHHKLLGKAKELMKDDGAIALILPVSEAKELITYSKKEGLRLTHLCEVQSMENLPTVRYMMRWQFAPTLPTQYSFLRLYKNDRRQRHPEYEALTKDFYL